MSKAPSTPPQDGPHWAEHEPERVRLNTSLVERPLFGGVDLEFFVISGVLLWIAFAVFGLSLPFVLMLFFCVGLYGAMRRANGRDAFFLPILIRALLYRRVYAPRSHGTARDLAKPSLPRRPVQH